MPKRDPGLDALLELDEVEYSISEEYWVKFEVKRCPITSSRPQGIRYSLTLHDRAGQRLLGFDNSHAVKTRGRNPYKRKKGTHDHLHATLRDRGQPYDYQSGFTLMTDFWKAVDKVVMKRR
ncbi:MAG TPA: DUF6516 family protein [Gammaproteobacteria bacterium]|jgi:hypothetical protein|nr:DUF6516 family protein [Gammaproteobacteria bacterium]